MNTSRVLPLLACVLLASAALVAQTTREVRKTLPLRADGRLSIDTYKGSISVRPWDKSEVEIVATIEADGSDWDSDEEEKVQATKIRIAGTDSEVRVKTDYRDVERRRSRGFWGMFSFDSGPLPLVHYDIRMPRTASLRIEDYKSSAEIIDLASDVQLNTYKGTVTIRGLEGSTYLETYKGEVMVEFRKLTASCRFETYKGKIEIRVPRGEGFDLEADLGRGGRLHSDFRAEEVRKSRRDRTRDVRAVVNGGGPLLRLSTYKGTYRLVEG